MTKIYVDIAPSIMQWIAKQLDEKIVSEDMLKNIQAWLSGTKKPTFRQIEALSKKTNIPLGYFFLQKPVEEKNAMLEYRTVDSIQLQNPSRELIDTIHQMEAIQDWMREYRKNEGYDKNIYVASLKNENNLQYITNALRNDIGLVADWYKKVNESRSAFNEIRQRLTDNGIVVFMNGCVGQNTHRNLDLNEFRAFAMVDEVAPLIFINAKDSWNGRLFSLLHEAVHIWLGKNDLFNSFTGSEKPEEILCNAVAAELLVPTEDFLHYWDLFQEKDTRVKIDEITKKFCCSNIVVARKALDNHKISQSDYNSILKQTMDKFLATKNSKASGGDFYKNLVSRLDKGLIKALVYSINSGKTSYTEAYQLTATNSKTFGELTKALGGC